MGRSTRDHTIDVDLTLEGPAAKVSRKQATIRLRNTGDFFMSSEGKRPIFVDGRPVLQGNKVKLNHNSVIEVRLNVFNRCELGIIYAQLNWRKVWRFCNSSFTSARIFKAFWYWSVNNFISVLHLLTVARLKINKWSEIKEMRFFYHLLL